MIKFPTTVTLATPAGSAMFEFAPIPSATGSLADLLLTSTSPIDYFVRSVGYLARVRSVGAWTLEICPASREREGSAIHETFAKCTECKLLKPTNYILPSKI